MLALLQDGGDLALHEGPGHVGPGQRAALSAGAEDLCVGSLLLDGLRGTRETELVVTDSGALKQVVISTLARRLEPLPARNVCPLTSGHKDCTSVKDCWEGRQLHLQM